MLNVETPPGFVIRTEAQKAAFDNGFRIEHGVEGGWLRYASTTARGEIAIAGASPRGPWLLTVAHPGVAAELANGRADDGPFVYFALSDLYAAIARVYRLGISLPDLPLDKFRQKTVALSRATEAERLIVQRIGQDIFRNALLEYWDSRCPMTGIADPALLRASHIVPWAKCSDDAQRLDVHNGLLLSALWDSAFDAGKISFADDGTVLFHPSLKEADRKILSCGAVARLAGLTPTHLTNLTRHRMIFFFDHDGDGVCQL